MQQKPQKFTDSPGAARLISQLSDAFAVVENPPYVFPPYDVYAMAAPRTHLEDGLAAAVMDMDGTTTTTEVLCTGALETMMRRLCGLDDRPETPILDHGRDYPHIIGNSTTKHVQYLVNTYRNGFAADAVCRHFIASCAWTLANALDARRAREAENALQVQGLGEALQNPVFQAHCARLKAGAAYNAQTVAPLAAQYQHFLRMESVADLTRIGIEVYYQQYHESLKAIAGGATTHGPVRRRPIEPMPGVGVALALLKGWLREDAARLGDLLAAHLRATTGADEADITAGLARLPRLGAYCAARPVKLGLVTSSIAAEADIVLDEVFRVIRDEIAGWPLPGERRSALLAHFREPANVYDARITASDSSEIRLKPHRDLYAIALHAMGIAPDMFHRVAGFEDSESGAIAIRAAGISLCCALPFAMTQNHQFAAATHVCRGGMPEVVLLKSFFLDDALF